MVLPHKKLVGQNPGPDILFGQYNQMEKGRLRTVLSKGVRAVYQESGVLGKRSQKPLEAPLNADNAGRS